MAPPPTAPILPRIVVLDGHTLGADGNSWAELDRLGAVELYDRSSEEEAVVRARDAAVLITNKAQVKATALEQAAGDEPKSRQELARAVRARTWGPGRFRRALRMAQSERRVTRVGRDRYARA